MAKRKLPDDIQDHIEKVRLIREASQSLEAYNKLLKESHDLENNLNYIISQRGKIEKELISLLADKRAYEEGFLPLNDAQRDSLFDQVKGRKAEIKQLDISIEKNERLVKIHKEAVDEVKLMAVAWKDVGRQVYKLGQELVKQTGHLLEQQKAVKETELQMGILSNQANGFRNNIYKSSITTTQIGVNTAELAKMQGRYSDNIGRSVQLSEEQLTAISELAKGTILGAEGAAEFAAEMESFNLSAKGSADYIEDILVTSHKMGVSSGAVIKNIQKNIKIAQKFVFKGGIKGLGKMAAMATKFKFEMQDIANFADKLITPEGAVEAAAKLQVLGGAWAKLGDPFELMYKSRNDLAGLTEDIVNATTATARFDEASGEVTIDPMELHRLREVANATGMNAENLAEMARTKARLSKIESEIPSIFDDEDKTFLSSLASWNAEKKEFQVTMQVGNETVTESMNSLQKITPEIVKSQLDFRQTLEDNAKQAMTFNERFEALKNTFKSGLLPAFEAVAGVLENLMEALNPMVKGIATFMAEWPKTFAVIGGVLAGIALIGKEALWLLRGSLLGEGFLRRTAGFGGGTPQGSSSPWKPGQKGPEGMFNKMRAGGKIGAGAGLKAGAGAGLLTGAMAGYGEWSENSEAGMDTGENVTRTILTGGGGIAGGALAGAAIGAFGGPLAPVTVPIGALIGSIAGAWGGNKLGDAVFSKENEKFQNDFVARPGEKAIPFNSNDTLIGAKPDGPIDKMLNNYVGAKPTDQPIRIELNEDMLKSKDKESGSFDEITKQFSKLSQPKPVEQEPKLDLNERNFNLKSDIPFDNILKRISQPKPVKEVPNINEKTFNLKSDIPFDNILKRISEPKPVEGVPGNESLRIIDELQSMKHLNKPVQAVPGDNITNFDSEKLININQKIDKNNRQLEEAKVSDTSGGKLSIVFDKPLRLEGRLELTSNGTSAQIDLTNPVLMRDLSKQIQEELTKAINGGKMSSNPVMS